MVKHSISNTKLSFACKNLHGVETLLRIDKLGGCVVITLERRFSSYVFSRIFDLVLAVLLLISTYYVVNNLEIFAFITAICLLVIAYLFVGIVQEECLTMVQSVGYQVTIKYAIGEKNVFIPWNQIQNIFINEVIIRHKVIHLLTIMTKENNQNPKLFPLFMTLQPRLKQLELIYKHIKVMNS